MCAVLGGRGSRPNALRLCVDIYADIMLAMMRHPLLQRWCAAASSALAHDCHHRFGSRHKLNAPASHCHPQPHAEAFARACGIDPVHITSFGEEVIR